MDLDEKKEQIKARRRAAYRKKKEEAATKQQDENQPAPLPPSTASGVIHDKKQARRQNDKERKRNLRLRDGQREQENAQRRADYRKNVDNGTIDLQQKNQNQREWRMQHRESMTSDEKGESSAQRKAKYAAKKNTLCAESIAMPRPDLTSTMSDSHATPDFRSTSVCLDGGPAMSMSTYPVGTDGKNWVLSLFYTNFQLYRLFLTISMNRHYARGSCSYRQGGPHIHSQHRNRW
mgnify:CR=1 FL=1